VVALDLSTVQLNMTRPSWLSDDSVMSAFRGRDSVWQRYTGDDLPVVVGPYKEDQEAYLRYFYGRTGGSFLELGALDGMSWSITRGFEAAGWHGLLIEANPPSYDKLYSSRGSTAVSVHAAVCSKAQVVHYTNDGDACCRGIAEFMSEAFLRMWHPQLTDLTDLSRYPSVACVPLSYILSEVDVQHVNLFVLDVEGAELSVLESVDWSSTVFDVIVVEADGNAPTKDQAVIDMLVGLGYVYEEHRHPNDWFLHRDFKPSSRTAPVHVL
jgi:FkbM family methyltransferase